MKNIPFKNLACPLDGKDLTCNGSSWNCANGHNFDIAKIGYTNLLPVQNKRTLDPGDHKEMVAARQRFSNGGHYQPIAEALSQEMNTSFSSSPHGEILSILDAGCGEGYYLREIASKNGEQTLALMGLDISKWAVMAAAKQDTQTTWVVGSNANLPVQTSTLDCVLCMFGFPVYAEFARTLKPGGNLLTVESGLDHLRELRDIIYPSLKPTSETQKVLPQCFSKISSNILNFSLTLNDAKDIADLLAMTPHFYRANAEGRAKAAALDKLTVTVEVLISRYQLLDNPEE